MINILFSLEKEEVLFKIENIWYRVLDLERKKIENLKGNKRNEEKRLIIKIMI